MRKITIIGADKYAIGVNPENNKRCIEIRGSDSMTTSDGYHTFDELYDHRITLYIALCRQNKWEDNELGCTRRVWRSKTHSDGTVWDGWFLLGIGKEKGEQITYHLPMIRWDETDFAETLDMAPEFDGHTPNDVLDRIKLL